jgi:hypothetical protein
LSLTVAVDSRHTLQRLGKLRHKPLKRIAKPIRIKIAEQAAEGVVTGQAVGQGEKAAQKWLLGLCKHSHIHRTLAHLPIDPRRPPITACPDFVYSYAIYRWGAEDAWDCASGVREWGV